MADGSAAIREGSLGARTLADVLAMIETDPALAPAQRREWVAALRRLARWLGREVDQLPASAGGLRYGIARLDPHALGISAKTLSNHKSALKQILRHAGDLPLARRGEPLASGWQPLWDRIDEVAIRRGLSQLIHWASREGIGPEHMSDAALDDFVAMLETMTFSRDPGELRRNAARQWNAAVDRIPGWPRQALAVPDRRPKRKGLPLTAFSDNFQADVADYLRRNEGDDLFDADGPLRPCRRSTLRLQSEQIRLAASAAVNAGVPIGALNALADLVNPDIALRVLRYYLARDKPKVKVFVIDLAGRLLAIARRWVKAPAADVGQLEHWVRKLGKHRPSGLTEKNLDAVRTITDPVNWRRLVGLPAVLMAEARRASVSSPRAAVQAQLAIVLQILLVAPMRIGNLANLSRKAHFRRVGGDTGVWHIRIAEADVKNSVPLEYPLPQAASMLLDEYLEVFRPRIAPAGCPWLIPGGKDGAKLPRTLSAQLTGLILERIRIRVTPHQFRHAAAAVTLKHSPGNYELVRRVLGHKTLMITIRHYVGLETVAAARQYGELVMSAMSKVEKP